MIFRAVRYQVSFWNGARLLDAELVIPAALGPRRAAVLVGGTSGPRDRGRWVEELALSGIATLSWDSPGWGTSAGPRRWQAPDERTLEVVAAAQFLHDLLDVSPGGVALVGADSGCWSAALGAALCSRVSALVLLTPPCTGAAAQEVHRLGQRLRAHGFVSAEVALAQLVLRERIRRLDAGQDAAAVLAAEAPCRHAPWYGWLPGTTPAELEAFRTLADYDPASVLSSVSCPVLGVLGADDGGTPVAANAQLLAGALASSPSPDSDVLVLDRTDPAFATVAAHGWEAPVAGQWREPQGPGGWGPEVVSAVAGWLGPRLGRHGVPAARPAAVPRAG
jgi:hypothetical protein